MSAGLGFLREIDRSYEKSHRIKIDLKKTSYQLFYDVAVYEFGWTLWGRKCRRDDANIFWVDTYITEQTAKRLNYYQRINHFPNSQQLCKKSNLSDNLKKMKQLMPNQYDFFPRTWTIPQNTTELTELHSKIPQWYIVKPSSSSQGKGIFLTNQINDIPKQNDTIVQQYITNPCLIDDCKFDLRIYVLIKSLIPLKVFRYVEGLTRLSIQQYEEPTKKNKSQMMVHLTNYSINKMHPGYVKNRSICEDWVGHKRSLSAVYEYLSSLGCNKADLQSKIDLIIMKTIMAAYPKMVESYKNCRRIQCQSDSVCFQVLGFDILIDNAFKPWLLEVNHSPSFCTDSPLDMVIKKSLIKDTFILLNIKNTDKQSYFKSRGKQEPIKEALQKNILKMRNQEELNYERQHLGGFVQLFPKQNEQKTNEIFKKVNQRANSKKNKLFISSQKCKAFTAEQKTFFKRQLKAQYKTFSGKLIPTNSDPLEQITDKEQYILRRHLLLDKDKKKMIEPIKMNNVNISFKSSQRSIGFSTIVSKNYDRTLNKTHDSKATTSETSRVLEKQIKLRLSKIKANRIRLKRMSDQGSHTVNHNNQFSPKKVLLKQYCYKTNLFERQGSPESKFI